MGTWLLSLILLALTCPLKNTQYQYWGLLLNLDEQQPRQLFMPFSAATTAYPNLAYSYTSLLPVCYANSKALLKFSLPSSKFFLVLEIIPNFKHPSISPLSSLISADNFRYFSTKIFILSLFSERSLVPILPILPIATDWPVMLLIWMECLSAFWKWQMLFLLSPNLSQHRPRFMEARNLPLTSARLSWRVWYYNAFFVNSGSASPRSWQSTPMQLQASASPWLSLILLQTFRNFWQYSTAFLCFLMLSQSTPMEQQERPSSLTLPALRHPKASISQSLSLRKTVTQVALSILSSFLRSYSVAVRLMSECSSVTREGVLKKRGNQILWGWEGAIERLLRCLLKLLTSFSSAREAPMRKERLRLGACRELVRLVLLYIINILSNNFIPLYGSFKLSHSIISRRTDTAQQKEGIHSITISKGMNKFLSIFRVISHKLAISWRRVELRVG